MMQGMSQKIETADVFSKLGNLKSIYQRSPLRLRKRNFFWETNISGHDIMQHTQIATDKCFCSQVTVKQSTVFF